MVGRRLARRSLDSRASRPSFHVSRMKLRSLALLLVAVIGLAPAASAQSTVDYSKLPARESRRWVRDAVIYEVFPRVFSATGDFAGVTAQLDRLQRLGVTVLWLMPIHPIGEKNRKGSLGSPYAARDYFAIDPSLGTGADLKRLVAEAHRRDMKVILDVVANHTAWDSVMMKTPELYTKNERGEIVAPVPDWADVADLDYSNPKTRDYMIGMLVHWIREYDIDGFRCDVAGMVPTDFWERARAEIDRVKPDVVLLAEWHEPDLLVKAFDLDYSWPLHSALDAVLTGRAPATRLRETWETERARYPKGALHMRFSDNHDERRAIARFGEHGALAASAFVLTLDGVPMLYNGMEVGDTAESGAPALFERLPIFWKVAERRPRFPRFYERMIALRKTHEAMRTGELVWLANSGEEHVATYLRRGGGEEILVAINFSGERRHGIVEVASAAGFTEITPSLDEGSAAAGPAALPSLLLDPWQFRIFRREAR
jgi:glycosidase